MGVLSKALTAGLKFAFSYPRMWFSGALEAALPAFAAAIFCLATYCLLRLLTRGDVSVSVRDSTKSHNWKSVRMTSKEWFCSVCEMYLLNGIGVYCDCCGVCADPVCIKAANKKLVCKSVFLATEAKEHHWVKGNLPFGARCAVCEEECSVEHGLVDFRCCWCQMTVHTACLGQADLDCDFGEFRTMIVPPHCIKVAKNVAGFHRRVLIKAVRDPEWTGWLPLIVVANRKSGSGDGELILSKFRRWLNPVQVIDLAERAPIAALQWCVMLAPKPVRILVAGGDGTAAWILSTAHKLNLDPEPHVCVLPLGTGNDLSRVLGWGKGRSPADVKVPELLRDIRSAQVRSLDRWKIDIRHFRHLSIKQPPNKTLHMYNYMSVGVDAQVALDFHRTRDSGFYLFSSRIFNKLLYLCFGTQQVVAADCKNLEQRVELWLDGKQVDLPELESIVVLNIPSWGAGVDLWEMACDRPSPQSYSDGLLEVLGIYSSFHIAQLQVGLSSPHILGQAKTVELRLRGKVPVQVDGEPWDQASAKITVSHVNRCNVLVRERE